MGRGGSPHLPDFELGSPDAGNNNFVGSKKVAQVLVII